MRRMLSLLTAVMAGTVFLGPGPVRSQIVSDRNDQPTPATVPEANEGTPPAQQPTGEVSPPAALAPSTSVTRESSRTRGTYTNPLDHLSPKFRSKNSE